MRISPWFCKFFQRFCQVIVWFTSNMEYFDVVIIGGGPAGSTSAITLSRLGHKVLLYDEIRPNKLRIDESLPSGTQQLLHKLVIMEQFLKESYMISYGNVFAWGSPKLETADFILNPYRNGWQINRINFNMFLQRIAQNVGTNIHVGKANVMFSGDEWCVVDETSQYDDVKCRWIVDASGRNSIISKKYGANKTHTDKLIAFVSFLDSNTKEDQDTRTLIESVSNGWWYTALIQPKKRVIVFLTDADLVDNSKMVSYDGFVATINKTLHISKIVKEKEYIFQDSIQGTNAGSSYLDKYMGQNWIAVGDAAMSFDPISSQGILNAMYTGISLVLHEETFEAVCDKCRN